MDLNAIMEALNVSVNAGAAGVVGSLVGIMRALGLGKRKADDEAKAKKKRALTVLAASVLGVGAVWLLDPATVELGARALVQNGIATGLLGGGLAGAASTGKRLVRRR